MSDDKKKKKMDAFRNRIDELDRRLIETLAERHKTVRDLFTNKLDAEKKIRDTNREKELLLRVRELATESGVDPYFAEKLFQDIISQSVRFQTYSLVDHQNESGENQLVRISYQGVQGAFSNQAALRHFSDRYRNVECIGFKTFEQAAEAVEQSKVDYSILPIENTTAGSINDTYDLLAQKDLHIVGEEVLHIAHCLMTPGKVKLENIRRILTHPQAIAQCSRFLADLPRCRVESYHDTAMAAQKVREDNDLSQAAIASSYAAELYGLHIVRKNIANQPENFTRFVVVSREPVIVDPQISCKTSLVFSTPHEKGALIQCLNVLDNHGINMTKLESRPRPRKPWQYRFFLDIEGNINDPAVEKGIRELEGKSVYLKVLGSYPRQEE
ncbi:MAG: prephenate dehydratase [Balneolaceae bacterium]